MAMEGAWSEVESGLICKMGEISMFKYSWEGSEKSNKISEILLVMEAMVSCIKLFPISVV